MDYRIHSPSGEAVAQCVYGEDAAAMVALYGDGATIRTPYGKVLWTEGSEKQPAAESYDACADTLARRRFRKQRASA